ncbi:MAG: CotH kinase family protein, partial [Verrucomicrobiales bacterium]|nr:CotH kinase family protein [Verrucomicrobiales bacterium]
WPMFGDEGADEFDNLDLRTSTNWNWAWFGNFRQGAVQNTFLRDIVSRDLQASTGRAYTRSRYYHLYLNGVYWGIYMTQERSEGSYAESYFGGDAEDYDVVKVNRGPGSHTEATDGDLGAWRALWQEARRHRSNPGMEGYLRMQGLGSDGERDESLPVLLDVDALIDYLLVIFWTANNDAPVSQWGDNDWSNNWYGIRERVRGDEGFRFLVHDAENSFGIRGYDLSFSRVITTLDRTGPFLGPDYRNSVFDVYNPQFLHQDLLGNAEYRLRFADRVQRLCSEGGVLTDDAVMGLLEARSGEVAPAILANAVRWGYRFAAQGFRYDEATWAAAAGVVESFVTGRTAVVLGQLEGDGLVGDIGVPVLNRRGGSVAGGFEVMMDTGQLGGFESGEIYYTTDGSDPRLLGGAVAGGATLYDGGGLVLEQSVRLKARLRATGRGDGEVGWSALEEVVLLVDAAPVDAESLVISEVHYHPTSPSDDEEAAGFGRGAMFEFVEIHNRGNLAMSLAGIRVRDGVELEIGEDDFGGIPAGGFGVIVNDEAAFTHRYGDGVLVLGEYSGDLSNGGERVVVIGAGGEVLDELEYGDGKVDGGDGWPKEADGDGSSLVLLVPEYGGVQAGPDGWGSSYKDGGTPGAADDRWRDRDGDGSDDRAELIGGTDVEDAADVFRLREIALGQGEVILRWPGVDGRRYQVEFARASAGRLNWSVISGELTAAEDGPLEFVDR